jgi:DnaK suppressor protein
MEEIELQELREKLVQRRRELAEEGDLAIPPNRVDPSEAPDEDTQPLTEMNQVIASRRNKERALEIQRIDAALARIEADPEDFGFCEECGEPLPAGRLELVPWARFCVECQEERAPRRGRRRRHAGDYID